VVAFRVGPALITRIEEVLEQGFEPARALPGFDPSLFERYPILASPNFYDASSGKLMSSIQSWLIRLGSRTILVDTASGNGKARALPVFQRFHMLDRPYLDNLARAGVTPDDVDTVFLTHLHVDHVGWNTRHEENRWVPTFRNARYLIGRGEFEHWTSGLGPRLMPENVAVIEDSVLPVVEAGLVDFVEPGDEIAPGLVVEAAPGHTATQLNLRYTAPEGESFVCSADVMNQPIQIYAPELNSWFCEDQEVARATRLQLLEDCARTGALLLPSHFGYPHAGYVRRDGNAYRFEPAVPAATAAGAAQEKRSQGASRSPRRSWPASRAARASGPATRSWRSRTS
jgi:glyoxylase-like metal-dependent hydrolase (beta-lactamase superfamily II)